MSVKDVKTELTKEHPDWKVPERRIKKFTKRHLSGIATGSDDGDTAVSELSSNKGMSFMQKMFSPRKKAKVSRQAAEPAAKTSLESAQEPEPEPEPVIIEEANNIAKNIYEDDNVAKVKEDCECNTCVIS
jgi:hypothetical protein